MRYAVRPVAAFTRAGPAPTRRRDLPLSNASVTSSMRHGQAVREGKQLETPASGPPQRLRARAADAQKGADPSGREPTSVATAAPTEQTLVQYSVALDPGYAVCRLAGQDVPPDSLTLNQAASDFVPCAADRHLWPLRLWTPRVERGLAGGYGPSKGGRRRRATAGSRRLVTSRTSHMPSSSWPGTRQTILYVPGLVVENKNAAAPPGGRPSCGVDDAAPGNAGAVVRPRTIAQECRMLRESFVQRTRTRQPSGISTRTWPLPYPLKLKPL
jgi:hypothetical protein